MNPVRIVQITDTHIMPIGQCWNKSTETRTHERLKNVIQSINALKPDLVIHTGDITDTGDTASYEHTKQLLDQLTVPYYLTCGNHDDFQNLRTVFKEQPFDNDQFSHYELNHLPVRILVLDSHVPHQDYGVLCEERKEWLATRLKEDREKPTLLFLHHFPIHVQESLFDTMNLRNGGELKQMILASPNVIGLYCGHYHHASASLFGQALCWISPSTAPTHILTETTCIGLNLTYPAYSIHEFQNGTVTSQIVSVAPTIFTRETES